MFCMSDTVPCLLEGQRLNAMLEVVIVVICLIDNTHFLLSH